MRHISYEYTARMILAGTNEIVRSIVSKWRGTEFCTINGTSLMKQVSNGEMLNVIKDSCLVWI